MSRNGEKIVFSRRRQRGLFEIPIGVRVEVKGYRATPRTKTGRFSASLNRGRKLVGRIVDLSKLVWRKIVTARSRAQTVSTRST